MATFAAWASGERGVGVGAAGDVEDADARGESLDEETGSAEGEAVGAAAIVLGLEEDCCFTGVVAKSLE